MVHSFNSLHVLFVILFLSSLFSLVASYRFTAFHLRIFLYVCCKLFLQSSLPPHSWSLLWNLWPGVFVVYVEFTWISLGYKLFVFIINAVLILADYYYYNRLNEQIVKRLNSLTGYFNFKILPWKTWLTPELIINTETKNVFVHSLK